MATIVYDPAAGGRVVQIVPDAVDALPEPGATFRFRDAAHPGLWEGMSAEPSRYRVDAAGLYLDEMLLVPALTRQQVLSYWARYCRDSAPEWGLFTDAEDYGALDTYAAALMGDALDGAALDAIETEIAAIAARYPGMPASRAGYERTMPEALRP